MTTPTPSELLAAGDVAGFLAGRADRAARDIARLRSEMATLAEQATAAGAAGHAAIAVTTFALIERRQGELAAVIAEHTTLLNQTPAAPAPAPVEAA